MEILFSSEFTLEIFNITPVDFMLFQRYPGRFIGAADVPANSARMVKLSWKDTPVWLHLPPQADTGALSQNIPHCCLQTYSTTRGV